MYCKYQCKGHGKKCDHQVPSPWCNDILISIFLCLLAAAAHAVHSSAQPRSSNCSFWQINRNWFHYNDKNSIISYNMCKISGYIIKSFSFITLFFSWINTDYYICAWQDMHCRLTKANKKKKASICGSLHNSTIPLILLLIVWKAWWFRKQSPNRVCRTCMTSDWTFHHRYWFCDFILCQMYLKELDEQFLQLHKIPRWVTRYCWLKETHDMKKSWETWNIYKVWIRQKPKHGYIFIQHWIVR